MIFFPCPEVHIDSGRVEAIIKAARVRFGYGMTDEEVHTDLVSRHVDPGQAHLAIVAAKLAGPLG